MRGPFRIEAYAIASEDGMIADSTGLMPNSLKVEADQRFFTESLDRAGVVVNGRMSYEGQPNSPNRKRLVLTRKVAGLAADPDNANARRWNPAGASLEEACAAVGCSAGSIAVVGGPEAYQLFLALGYDAFYLVRAIGVRLPGGVSVFPEGGVGRSPEQTLTEAGLAAGPPQWLGVDVPMTEWTPAGALGSVG
jgi:dihydrofolate reductase